MKALNLMALALGGAFGLVMLISVTAEYFLSRDTAMLVVLPLAMFIGLSARRTAEKILGYTMLEALRDGRNDADGP